MDLNSMNGSGDDGDLKGSNNSLNGGGGTQSLQLFDFISTKMDLESPMNSSSSLTLTPIELIDPSDYGIDDNNNNFVTVAPMKSILDEMIHLEPGDHSGVNGGSLELLGTFHWGDATNSSNSSSSVSLSLMSPSGILPGGWHTQAHLLHAPSSNETEVQTLTTLMTDPLFVSFEDSILMKPHQDGHGDLSSSATSPSVISSDLISTTYREKSLSTVWPAKEDLHPHHHDPQVPSSPSMCDDSLLRSALQAIPSNKANKQEGPLQGMSELRKVLSYPPLPNIISSEMQVDGPFYEFKILPDGAVEDDSFLPNVEELIMTRNDPSFSSAALNRLSTSTNNSSSTNNNNNNKSTSNNALSAKWTYTTTSSNNNSSSEGTKRKRSKIIKEIKKESLSESSKDNNSSSPGSPAGGESGGSGNGGGGSVRKERSLHYCTMCAKGFKDKYSVNVHVRTHTGEKPFACTTCGKSFRQKAHLAKHYQTHTAKGNSTNPSNSKNKSNSSSNGQSSSTKNNNSSLATPTFS